MRLLTKIVLLVFLFTYAEAHKGMIYYLQRCTSNCNKDYCKVVTVCRPVNRTSKFSGMDIYFHPGVKLEAPIMFEVLANKKFVTVYRQHMLKIKREVCEFLSDRNNTFFRMAGIFAHSWKIGNIYDPCPLTGHRFMKSGYTTTNTYDFPLIPVGEWRMDYLLTKPLNGSEVHIVSWSDYYEVKPTGAEQF